MKPKLINGGKKILIPDSMQADLNKIAARAQYRAAMLVSFKLNFEMIEQAGMNELYKSFLQTGSTCKFITAGEYADLAVKTFEEVKAMR